MINSKLQPLIYKIDDNEKSLKAFEKNFKENESEKKQDIIFNYPTVYIHNWKDANQYEVYIGETNSIIQRTKEHFFSANNALSWRNNLLRKNAQLYIIGHEHFNKSITLDVEHRLMLYMMSVESIKKIHNKRGNPQNKYYPDFEFEEIFQKIWRNLQRTNPILFPSESRIKKSAVFKASPLHKLTDEQENAKEFIVKKVFDAIKKESEKQLIFVEGEAGTGKTVLNSSAFYDLYMKAEAAGIENFQCYLMVNHDEQIMVYEQIAKKLGLIERYGEIVCKPTTFINHHSKDNPVDVAFVDEAHLLLTQGKQSYRGKNQLQDIIQRSKVVIVMFDENQILTTEQYWEEKILNYYKNIAKQSGNYIELKNQLRMSADKKTIEWIDAFTKRQTVDMIPVDTKNYEIKIFSNPELLERAIKEKYNSEEFPLSRMVATYDWEYKKSSQERLQKYWEVLVGNWHKPWNRELERKLGKKEKKKIKDLAWAEQPQTIDEIGSTFTIQGFDLNYVGVILGPSVKYREGKIIFDPEASCNQKATRNRTLSDGTRKKFGEKLIQHEVRVLMTRGVNGLYIYACDEELRTALLKSAENQYK